MRTDALHAEYSALSSLAQPAVKSKTPASSSSTMQEQVQLQQTFVPYTKAAVQKKPEQSTVVHQSSVPKQVGTTAGAGQKGGITRAVQGVPSSTSTKRASTTETRSNINVQSENIFSNDFGIADDGLLPEGTPESFDFQRLLENDDPTIVENDDLLGEFYGNPSETTAEFLLETTADQDTPADSMGAHPLPDVDEAMSRHDEIKERCRLPELDNVAWLYDWDRSVVGRGIVDCITGRPIGDASQNGGWHYFNFMEERRTKNGAEAKPRAKDG